MAEPPHHRVGFEDTLNLSTSLCLSYALCTAVLRAWVRKGNYGADDAITVVAVVTCIGLFATSYLCLSHGAGKPWSYILAGGGLTSLNQASIAGFVMFTISLYMSKCSVLAFLLRLTKDSKQIRLYQACIALLALIGIASVLLVTVALPSESGYYWNFYRNSSDCAVQTTRWNVFTTLDIFTEVVLLILPAYQLFGLQMALKKKAIVLSAFYLRLPVIAISVGRLVFTNRLCHRTTDAGLGSSLVMIWIQIEASYAIIANTFSALRAFTMSFNSGFGYGFTVHAGPEDYKLSKLDKSTQSSTKRDGSNISASQTEQSVHGQPRDTPVPGPYRTEREGSLKLEPKIGQNTTQVSSDRQTNAYRSKWREDGSSSEQDPEDHAIVRETEYSVVHDEMPILSLHNGRRV